MEKTELDYSGQAMSHGYQGLGQPVSSHPSSPATSNTTSSSYPTTAASEGPLSYDYPTANDSYATSSFPNSPTGSEPLNKPAFKDPYDFSLIPEEAYARLSGLLEPYHNQLQSSLSNPGFSPYPPTNSYTSSYANMPTAVPCYDPNCQGHHPRPLDPYGYGQPPMYTSQPGYGGMANYGPRGYLPQAAPLQSYSQWEYETSYLAPRDGRDISSYGSNGQS